MLPLYGRLSSADQHKVFQPSTTPGTRRRIVLATNVAETSLTVPGIKYVIDAGTARISRYSVRSKIQRLPIEAISQASPTNAPAAADAPATASPSASTPRRIFLPARSTPSRKSCAPTWPRSSCR